MPEHTLNTSYQRRRSIFGFLRVISIRGWILLSVFVLSIAFWAVIAKGVLKILFGVHH